jgi:hypothetical protein
MCFRFSSGFDSLTPRSRDLFHTISTRMTFMVHSRMQSNGRYAGRDTHSECMYVALVIQRARRMRRIILPDVAYPALLYFFDISSKRHDFRRKVKFWFSLQMFSENFLLLKEFCEISQMSSTTRYYRISIKPELSQQIFGKHVSNFIKIRTVEAELFMPTGCLSVRNIANSRFSILSERDWKWHSSIPRLFYNTEILFKFIKCSGIQKCKVFTAVHTVPVSF